MHIVNVIAGIVVLGGLFGLMVWGQKYLGEEKGRNPGKASGNHEKDVIENPCRNCGGCEKKDALINGEFEKLKHFSKSKNKKNQE